MLNEGLERDHFTYSSIIAGYLIINEVKEVEQVFRLMEENGVKADVVCYNVLINVYCKGGMTEMALAIVKKMTDKGMKPNIITYSAVLHGLRKEKYSSCPTKVIFNLLFDGICKAQFLEKAL